MADFGINIDYLQAVIKSEEKIEKNAKKLEKYS